MSAEFENNPRRKQELKMRPFIDAIYRNRFGNDIVIQRFDHDDALILDKEFAIDVKITMPNKMIILGQEKALSSKYKKYKTLTVEYEQDQSTHEPGDWFKLSVQFYFCGYSNDDGNGFESWVIVDWMRLAVDTNNDKVHWYFNSNKDGSARASFTYTYYEKLPDNCIIACSWVNYEQKIEQAALWDYIP